MLQVLRTRVKREPQGVRRNITAQQGDMRKFRLGKKYPLVTIPFRPLQHMCTVEDQVKALATASWHLQDKGLLAFDVFYPKFDLIQVGIGQEIPDLEWTAQSDSVPAPTVRRYFRKESVDKINQIFSFTFVYKTYEDAKLVLEETERLTLSYYTYPHLKALFLLAGLEVVEEYGSYAKALLDNSSEQMIFLLRRAKRGRS